jgi:hypothetical protein
VSSSNNLDGVASPAPSSSSPVFRQWRAAGGEHLTFSEVGWTGAAAALTMHAALHFFSVAVAGLERLLVLFAPAERLAFALTGGAHPMGRWLLLLAAVAVWGALGGIVLLSAAREIAAVARRLGPTL